MYIAWIELKMKPLKSHGSFDYVSGVEEKKTVIVEIIADDDREAVRNSEQAAEEKKNHKGWSECKVIRLVTIGRDVPIRKK